MITQVNITMEGIWPNIWITLKIICSAASARKNQPQCIGKMRWRTTYTKSSAWTVAATHQSDQPMPELLNPGLYCMELKEKETNLLHHLLMSLASSVSLYGIGHIHHPMWLASCLPLLA